MSVLSDLTSAVDAIEADEAKYHAIIHGPATGAGSTVVTDSGTVKTLAKAIYDFENTNLATFLTALGVPTYANLTAANTTLAVGMPYYDTALSKLQITTA